MPERPPSYILCTDKFFKNCRYETISQAVTEVRKKRASLPKMAAALLVLSLASNMGKPMKAFTTYDCSNRNNIVESYSLLEPVGMETDGNREMRLFYTGRLYR
jgi:hypothetical protein